MGEPYRKPAHVIWTYDDLQIITDDRNRYEVIDGELLATPSPTSDHQRASKRIFFELLTQIERAGLGEVFHAPLDVILTHTRVVIPDLLVVRNERRNFITQRGVETPPDLVVEILSPSSLRNDREVKRKFYGSVGVPEYWIADPAEHTIEVLALGPEGYVARGNYGPGQHLVSVGFPVAFDVDPIFAP